MMTERQAEMILMGAALLEFIGNLYEYIGSDGRNLIFQNVNDDSTMTTTYQRMINECAIQF